jgi:hypothetical protein
MATILPWTNVEIGELDVATPAMPCLLVHTSYVDGEPESSVTFFWQDDETGFVNHEVLLLKPMEFDEALAWAKDHAATNQVQRIHVKHGRPQTDAKSTRRKLSAAKKRKSVAAKTTRRPDRQRRHTARTR